ncbi:leucyl aminopeptidase [Diaphorobacter sp. HDW4A]|uniref:leucyl aminopeptidase n=1 Tax=Diaphorobacter sp. HDW4A TaxID=2714924 RepID=UPI0014075B77|nr:leucyl aminopeptidase [Diaphorobacter sp. HDW4A]QIL79853.1 leucyl aminopeptidase [Diaphorobacter sp. HDW4A]
MNFELTTLTLSAASSQKCDALIVLVPEGVKPGKDAVSAILAQALKSGDLELKAGKNLQIYASPLLAARRVILAGTGDGSVRSVRLALAAVANVLKSPKVKKAVVVFAGKASGEAVATAVQCCADLSYVYTTTKSKAEPVALARLVVGVEDSAKVKSAFDMACAVAKGVGFAREWANRPANHATPTMLANAAKGLTTTGITCKVHGPAEVAKLGMGAFLAVAQGSAEQLRFIELRYNGAAKSEAPVVLIGKGITFDTGGISLKPAAEMDEMKFDMGGAASVLGVFAALAELRPAVNVVGLIPACENMPDGKAVKPGDVVTSMNGQTIEILNTDAEGRLVLCDAITYAARFKPQALVDIATLTGACVIALGNQRSGLFASDDALAAQLQAAGDAAQDLCWRMPLDDEYGEGLRSNFADVANVAGRAGGAITAAKFLQRFTGSMPWAHLDIAGTAWKSGAAKGATGRPVGLLMHYLANVAGSSKPAPKPARKKPVARKTA